MLEVLNRLYLPPVSHLVLVSYWEGSAKCWDITNINESNNLIYLHKWNVSRCMFSVAGTQPKFKGPSKEVKTHHCEGQNGMVWSARGDLVHLHSGWSLTNGVLRMRELADAPEESFTTAKCVYCLASIPLFLITCTYLRRENCEHRVFATLLQMVPGLEGRLIEGSDDDLTMIAEMVSLIGVLPDVLVDFQPTPGPQWFRSGDGCWDESSQSQRYQIYKNKSELLNTKCREAQWVEPLMNKNYMHTCFNNTNTRWWIINISEANKPSITYFLGTLQHDWRSECLSSLIGKLNTLTPHRMWPCPQLRIHLCQANCEECGVGPRGFHLPLSWSAPAHQPCLQWYVWW